MARPGTRHPPFCRSIPANLTNRHDFFPVRPVPILDHHGDRTADGLSVPHSGEKTYLIPFYLHPAAPPKTALPTLQFMIDEIEIDGEVSWHAFHESDQRLAVRFASRPEAQHGSSIMQACAPALQAT